MEQRHNMPRLAMSSLSYQKRKQNMFEQLLGHFRAVDTTILTALSSIATEQAKPTKETMKKVRQLLDYCATQKSNNNTQCKQNDPGSTQ
jgi:hypothetical protein